MSKKSVEKKLKGGFFSFSQKVPSGITLTSEETKEVIELWKEDVEVIKTNTEKLSSADIAIERNLTKLQAYIHYKIGHIHDIASYTEH